MNQNIKSYNKGITYFPHIERKRPVLEHRQFDPQRLQRQDELLQQESGRLSQRPPRRIHDRRYNEI